MFLIIFTAIIHHFVLSSMGKPAISKVCVLDMSPLTLMLMLLKHKHAIY